MESSFIHSIVRERIKAFGLGQSLSYQILGNRDRLFSHALKLIHYIFESLAGFAIFEERLSDLDVRLIPTKP